MTGETISVADWLRRTSQQLHPIAGDSARLEAELLLSRSLGIERSRLYLNPDQLIGPEHLSALAGWVERRLTFEPIAYILGDQEFWGHSFKVSKDTLIPRPDSEALVEAVLNQTELHEAGHMVDLGTGTGCLLLSILIERPNLQGIGVDCVQGAVDLASENALTLGLEDRAVFSRSHWMDAVKIPSGGFDVIVSNPPYIDAAAAGDLMPDVRLHEPVSALIGGKDGLDCYRQIVKAVDGKIRPGGLLAFEIGFDQASSVPALLDEGKWEKVACIKDLSGNDRVITAIAR